tara:strand:+ start:37581 stop:38633 length:1053 start_codon:yes stop_codon:yes gene_type:complete
MRRMGQWLLRLGLVLGLCIMALLAPVAWVEITCRGEVVANGYVALLPPDHRRAEARTLLTYPEWHIVHAYDDYAQVIQSGHPHDFGYLRAIRSYWSSLCALSEQAGAHGGVDTATKQLVYVIGTSFTAELALKAAYEETLGRLFTLLRGPQHSPLDDLSADQAAAYAKFLQQVPWYKWDFDADRTALAAARSGALRDHERNLALGAEYAAKSAYAGIIASAVAATGADELTLRMIVTGASTDTLAAMPDVSVIANRSEGIEIETPRYRALTHLLVQMAGQGVNAVEIAGNDDILLTVISDSPTMKNAIFSFPRQGYGDTRHLLLVKVADLMPTLRAIADGPAQLEHVHDY